MTLGNKLKSLMVWMQSFEYRGGDPQQEQHEPFNPLLEPPFLQQGGIVQRENLPNLIETGYIIPQSRQENARQDYEATIEHMSNALREQGFGNNRECRLRAMEMEFNHNFSNYNPNQNDEIILNNQSWRIIEWVFEMENQRFVLENIETQERITIRRSIASLLLGNIVEDNHDFQIVWNEILKKKPSLPLMDRKYPHVCYECEKNLEYRHAFGQACEKYNHISFDILNQVKKKEYIKKVKETYTFEKQFRKQWKHPLFHFFCCDCFRTKKIQEKYFEEEKPTKNNHEAYMIWAGRFDYGV